MNKNEAINKFLQIAEAEVGYHEGENNYNKFAAQLDPLNITYGAKQNQPWCGEFVLWCAVKAFGVEKGLRLLRSPRPTGIPLCSEGARYFREAGQLGKSPERGDIVFFNYSGGINHTGIVASTYNGAINTVEGNCGDAVKRCVYSAHGGNISGYGRPDWAAVCEDGSDEPKQTVDGLPLLRYGDMGETVRAAQILLIGRGYTCGGCGADGEFGPATRQAVENYQTVHNLEVDGVIGPATWASLLGV